MDINIGNAIKKLRLVKGVTQEELAEYIGISFQAVSKWENGATMPDISVLPMLAIFFGVRIDDLFSITHDDELERIDHILAHEKMTERNFDYAQSILEAILQDDENDVSALKRYAQLYLARNNDDLLEAARMLERAMTLSPSDPEVFSLYRQACGNDKYAYRSSNDLFIRVCEPYTLKSSKNYKLYEMLIEAALEMGYYEKAAGFVKSVELDETNRFMREIFLGDIEAAKGNLELAKSKWNSVPENDHKGQYEAGERFSRINEYSTAIKCFKNSFDAANAPRDLSAIYSLAFLYTKLGMIDKAINAWELIISVLASDYNITESETVDWAKREIEKLKE